MRTITVLTLSLIFVSVSFAQNTQQTSIPKAAVPVQKTDGSSTAPSLILSKAAIALNINNLEPENVGDTFPAEVHRLFCFTQIKGASGPAEIQHRWYWKDELMSTISLQINSGNFRTYSSKSIPIGLKGDWRVSVIDSRDESILGSIKFITQ